MSNKYSATRTYLKQDMERKNCGLLLVSCVLCLMFVPAFRSSLLPILSVLLNLMMGDRGSTVIKVLCYKSEGRLFDSRWCHWNFLLT